jgi:tetratricopeptide (TPR) repeat protein
MKLSGARLGVVICIASLTLSSCGFLSTSEQPQWVTHFQAADELWPSNFDEWDRQAKLVVAEADRYGGRMPPPEALPYGQRVMEGLLFWFPLQDRGESTTYSSALNTLASHYESCKKYDDAEKLYRKAVALETAEKAFNPRLYVERTYLAHFLQARGRGKEAGQVLELDVQDAQANAAQHPNSGGYYQQGVLYKQSRALEAQGKYAEAESCLKKVLELNKQDLAPQSIARVKEENASASKGVSYRPQITTHLENLAEFYSRRGDYANQEKILQQIIDVNQSVLPANSPKMVSDWDNLATTCERHDQFAEAEKALVERLKCGEDWISWERLASDYAEQKKYDRAIQAMRRSLELFKKSDSYKEPQDFASIQFRYGKLLERAGKHAQGETEKAAARQLAPAMIDSTNMYWREPKPAHGKRKD